MTVSSSEQRRKLEAVHQLREARALRDLHAQRNILTAAVALRNKHRSQASQIWQALHELSVQRDSLPADQSVDTLVSAANRRHWLMRDLRIERAELDKAVSELENEHREYQLLRNRWLSEREHLSRLQELESRSQVAQRRKSNRIDENLLDEFVAIPGVNSHG